MPCTEIKQVDLLALHRLNPERYPFLLQSAVVAQPRPVTARYDMLFAFPGDSYALWADNRITRNGESCTEGDFLQLLDKLWQEHQLDIPASDELPFTGGWFVYLGYELAAQIEPRLSLPKDDEQPVAVLTRIPAAVIFDHHTGQTRLVVEPDQASILAQMKEDIERVARQIPRPPPALCINMAADDPRHYLHGVERVKHYIVEGDVFQVNLSRGWQGKLNPAPPAADLYQLLCQTNPAPFAALAQLPNLNVISSSPERLVKISRGRIETRPIAGTRPRGKEQHGDSANLQELIGHPKERAEHIMLIDLERNDLGRVCEPGSVEVDELMGLETYAHVHHIVSNVTGRLREGVTPGEAIRAVFPGGTITGCPKERCMAIIAELEQVPRGAYTGSIGYLNHNGELDLNILIRTITQQGDQIALRAGAGLVFDSVADNELRETEHKALGMLLAPGGTAVSLLACRVNGVDSTQLAVTDRACQYGDGLFETLAVRGSKVEFLDAHLLRLGEGAQRLGIPAPDPALWRADIRLLLEGHQQGVLKLILSRGSGGRGYLASAEPRVSRIVMLYPWPDHPLEYTREGVQLRWCQTRLAIQPQLAGIKHLNRLEQILARREWTDPAVQEGLMQDSREQVIEGTMSNLFLLKGDTLHTPDLSDCGVRGIMRQQMIDLASQSGMTVQCADYSRQDVDTADGLFLTNSIIGLWPVRQLEGVHFRPNPLLRQLQEQLDALRWQHAESDF